jgi:hypothetical protein
MHYNVVFDITQAEFHHWSDLAGGFVFIICAIGMFWFHWRRIRHVGWLHFSYFIFIGLFLILWSLFPFYMFFDGYRNYLDIKTAMQRSQCQIAEGVVTQFGHLPQWKGRGVGEKFAVNGKQFGYRDGSAQNGFHQIGIVRNGMQVRIYYYDKDDHINNDIARLEIAQ